MRRIKRWDVYDVADELADIPWMLNDAIDDERLIPEIADMVERLANQLFEMAQVHGSVGPAPSYKREV